MSTRPFIQIYLKEKKLSVIRIDVACASRITLNHKREPLMIQHYTCFVAIMVTVKLYTLCKGIP